MVLIAEVAVEMTAYHFDKPFSYIINEDVVGEIAPGDMVVVPFGGGNRSRQGIVLSVSQSEDNDQLKPILKRLGKDTVLNEEQLKIVHYLNETTFCTLYEAARSMFPSGLKYIIKTKFVLINHEYISENRTENAVIAELKKQFKPVSLDEIVLDEISEKSKEKAIYNLVGLNVVAAADEDFRKIGDKTFSAVEINSDILDENGEIKSQFKFTSKQKEVISLLLDIGVASIKEVNYFTGISDAVIRNLVNKKILNMSSIEVYRTPYEDDIVVKKNNIILNDEQSSVYNNLKELSQSGKPEAALLFGVTGSGKTSVYLSLIDEVLETGKTVLVTVPEISLTPQTLSIFRNRYGDRVAVMHSALSLGERLDEWKRIKNGEVRIVVGTRSACFAPLSNIGLIVMDEEQEHSYKSDSAPRYHARDVLRYRAAYNNCLLLMCSATPSVESYMKALSGIYHLERITKRYGKAVLPNVTTVDMRPEIEVGNDSGISNELYELIDDALCEKHQVILLLNRRGYNTHIVCRECGNVLSCDNCSISMVYHRDNDRLMCHYCGKSEKRPEKCPNCGGSIIRYTGVGTQYTAEKLAELFPEARILRMDADTTLHKGAHKKALDSFSNHEYDILIGTQMVAKGLDFPNVTLVGVIDADGVFYNNDFRSYERAFDLLTQVIGRAGRSNFKGTAVIQTATPENELICLSAEQDYERFFNDEITARKLMEYPPYCDICMVGFVGMDKKRTQMSAECFLEDLKNSVNGEFSDVKIRAMGPSSAQVPKINMKYRFKILLKFKNNARFRMMMSQLLRKTGSDPNYKNVTVYADINPSAVI